MIEAISKIVFSPTGGTQNVADKLAQGLAGSTTSVNEIDLSNPLTGRDSVTVHDSALAIIAMPCFGGRVPAVAMERLSHVNGNNALAIAVVVYGNRAFDDALLELERGVADAGFRVVACVAAVAEHSIMHQFATGRPDAKDDAMLQSFAKTIKDKLQEGSLQESVPKVPGNEPYVKAGSVPLVPKISGQCTLCGECAKGCPTEAISTVNYEADKSKCISCMRCIPVCPQQARSVSKTMVKVASLAIRKAATTRKECELFIR